MGHWIGGSEHSRAFSQIQLSNNPKIHLPICPFVAGDQAVADADDALRVARDGFLVRDDDDGVSVSGKLVEQREDFRAGF